MSFFVLVYLFTCLSELDSNNKRANENYSFKLGFNIYDQDHLSVFFLFI